jgi:hypothetical protein
VAKDAYIGWDLLGRLVMLAEPVESGIRNSDSRFLGIYNKPMSWLYWLMAERWQ